MLYRYRGEGAAAIGLRAVDIPGKPCGREIPEFEASCLASAGMALE
jgi:hypothetical protein